MLGSELDTHMENNALKSEGRIFVAPILVRVAHKIVGLLLFLLKLLLIL